MIVQVSFSKKKYNVDLSTGMDISLPIQEGANNPSCYWADPVTFETISSGDFIGSVAAGGNVNYQKLTMTPHGNGTHTECYGHISADKKATIQQCLRNFHFMAEVISVTPEKKNNGDQVIRLESVKNSIKFENTEALILRTLPNTDLKKHQHYSGTNPPYIDSAVAAYLADRGVQHLLLDLPSVDRESDEGKLLAHRAFWRFPEATRKDCTITELIFVDNTIADGLYFLNLPIISLDMDASPSKPMLYKLTEVS
jgi:arylformamidase